jgi:hypothetical protein
MGGSVVDVVVGARRGGGSGAVVGSVSGANTALVEGASAVTVGAAARPVVQLANRAAATKKGDRRTKKRLARTRIATWATAPSEQAELVDLEAA